MEIIGHRGAALREPENTLRGIRHALDAGADGVEIDVRLSRDGEAFLLHDERIDRTTRGKGLACGMDWGGLRLLDAGKGESIPKLTEAVLCVADYRARGSAVRLFIEIKEAQALAAALLLIRQENGRDWMELSSFDASTLVEAKRLLPEVRCALIADSLKAAPLHQASRLGLQAVHLKHTAASTQVVQEAAHLDLMLRLWTVNTPADVRRARDLGVAGIMTDDPEQASRVLRAS
jgi:glycerophosphoryl diester phosphodiesterase